jgi:hypothetical protein
VAGVNEGIKIDTIHLSPFKGPGVNGVLSKRIFNAKFKTKINSPFKGPGVNEKANENFPPLSRNWWFTR